MLDARERSAARRSAYCPSRSRLFRPAIGATPLFPAPGNDAEPIARRLVTRWPLRAEKLAKLPKLERGAWHPLPAIVGGRAEVASRCGRRSSGWRDTRALKLSYQQADPATVLRAVEG